MLWNASSMMGYGLRATDGSIGSVKDLLFDDADWTLRWVVVDTGNWLPGRQVLLPPSAFDPGDPSAREFPVRLTRDRIKESPSLAEDAPVSRQMEADLHRHYGWPPYWAAGYAYHGYVAPTGAFPGAGLPVELGDSAKGGVAAEREPRGDPNLRSVREVTGYYVRATDDQIGHIEEFLIDDNSWSIRYLVIDTKNWWPGKMVLVSPQWIRDVDWSEQQVFVALTREGVKNSPEYNPTMTVDRRYEEQLYSHYGRAPYWE